MKRSIFTPLVAVLFINASAQTNLRPVITGEQGLSKQFTTFDESLQVAFNPSKARDIFGLDINSDLVLLTSETDKLGVTSYRFTQTYKSIPIENAMYIVHTSSG